jgi:hypothetical protein
MKPRHLILVAGITAALSCGAFAQKDEKLGKLSFPTSCDPKVQTDFERGVAMVHSYWFIYARRTFEGVLQQGPKLCDRVLGNRARLSRQLARHHADPGRGRSRLGSA